VETKWADHVTSDPQVLAGKPIVRGTRLAVDFILGLFASGWTHHVLQNYPSLMLRLSEPYSPAQQTCSTRNSSSRFALLQCESLSIPLLPFSARRC
jgi:hypothetical protein